MSLKTIQMKINYKHYNKLLWGVITILALNSCSNQTKKNDWTEDNLKGKVQSYTEFSYKAEERFGNIEKGIKKREYGYDIQFKYDDKGNKIEKNEYNSDGSLNNKHVYKYDEKGNNIEINSYSSDGNLQNKWTYKYDEKYNKVEYNIYNSDGRLQVGYNRVYKYDKNAN